MTTLSQTNQLTDPLGIPEKRIVIDKVLEEYRHIPGATMVILNELQTKIGYITEPMQSYIAKKLKVSVGTIHGVVTFYSFFTTQQRGKHTVKFCMGTACYVRGGKRVMNKASQVLGVEAGGTTEDMKFTLEKVNCLGCCSLGPMMTVDNEYYGKTSPGKVVDVLKNYA